MGETLDRLRRLQTVETKLAVIRRAIDTKARQVDLKRKNVLKAEERLKEHHKAVRELQIKIDGLSLEVESREDSIAKHREALNKAKTNKEYAAILTAMNTEKADNSKEESELLCLMDNLQVLKKTESEIEEDQKKWQSEVAAVEATVAAFEKQCEAELTQLTTQRDQCASGIVAGALSVFNRVAERHDGEALAPVIKVYPKREEFSCSGCNIKLTLEVVNSLRTREDLQICHVCGRILYLESQATLRTGS
ncbi:MAG: hypothetical protein AABZ47_08135 [Planctomycetota bacterium]